MTRTSGTQWLLRQPLSATYSTSWGKQHGTCAHKSQSCGSSHQPILIHFDHIWSFWNRLESRLRTMIQFLTVNDSNRHCRQPYPRASPPELELQSQTVAPSDLQLPSFSVQLFRNRRARVDSGVLGSAVWIFEWLRCWCHCLFPNSVSNRRLFGDLPVWVRTSR